MDDGDVAALHLQAARGFEAEQSAADDDGPHALSGAREPAARVVEIAEGEDVFLVDALDRRDPRVDAGGEQQLVVVRDAAVVAVDGAALGVDVDDPHAQAQGDVVLLIPVQRIDRDVVGGALAREHAREQDAVVVGVRLVAEDRDAELRRVLEDLLQAGDSGHSVPTTIRSSISDHSCECRDSAFSTFTAHCLKFGSREIGSNALCVTRFEFVSTK